MLGNGRTLIVGLLFRFFLLISFCPSSLKQLFLVYIEFMAYTISAKKTEFHYVIKVLEFGLFPCFS